MSGEEIRTKILEYQAELELAMRSGYSTFELNSTIVETKNKINALREQCDHGNNNFTHLANGRCPYCNKKIQ